MESKIGIVNITKTVIAAIKIGEKIEKNILDDGELTPLESIGIGLSSFNDIVMVIRSGNKLKEEYKDLDEVEKETLVKIVKEELDLKNDKVEYTIETAIELLLGLSQLIEAIKLSKK